MKIGEKYLIPSNTTVWMVNLQQSFVTTKEYILEIEHTSNESVFGMLYDIIFRMRIPSLLKIPHSEVHISKDVLLPIGDILEPKIFDFKYL